MSLPSGCDASTLVRQGNQHAQWCSLHSHIPITVKEEELKAKAAALQEKLAAKGQKKGGKKK
jgi:hypothetical protein